MNQISQETVTITTTGGDGAATGSGTTIPINGLLLDVFLNYHASAPATTDVTISDSVFGNLLVKSNNATDIWLAPRKQTCDGAAVDTGLYDLIPVHGQLTIAVAGANALTGCLVATIRWLEQ
ncbi:MAG: hypothetical protein C3F13_18055 [Anaerolineales bacterium]|nr:hypothetical protein [Anaerolineae bacterium]PWB49742.1 MAG: hypothetical protein C3F13_18055 [Anaerolineales bacterium]